ncbi:MAG: MarR family winged helix-turn-helix transcriptional regulator [Geminicoccaceae bacterium]
MSTSNYAETINLIERLHRRFLDVLRGELERIDVGDINNVQGLLLANIGEEEVSVGDLVSRGYYLGSNVTYNLKRLVDAGYVEQERSARDRRVVRIRLSEKGRDLCQHINAMLNDQSRALQESPDLHPLDELNAQLRNLEVFWAGELSAPKSQRSGSALGNFPEQRALGGSGH